MKIKTEPKGLYNAIICLEETCLYRKNCANHVSAGDFRSEDGFTPKLSLGQGNVFCKTTDHLPLTGLDENFPDNFYHLQSGLMLWDDIVEEVENYNI
jgi:hypothetical protein